MMPDIFADVHVCLKCTDMRNHISCPRRPVSVPFAFLLLCPRESTLLVIEVDNSAAIASFAVDAGARQTATGSESILGRPDVFTVTELAAAERVGRRFKRNTTLAGMAKPVMPLFKATTNRDCQMFNIQQHTTHSKAQY